MECRRFPKGAVGTNGPQKFHTGKRPPEMEEAPGAILRSCRCPGGTNGSLTPREDRRSGRARRASDTTDAAAFRGTPAASWQPKPGYSSGGPASHVRPGPGPPDPTAFHRRGPRRPRAALRNPVPETSDPCLRVCFAGPDPSPARASRGAALARPSFPRPSQPVRRPRVPGPPGPAPPSPPDLPAPCGTLAAPTVGPIPARARIRRRRPLVPSTAAPGGCARRREGNGVAAFRPACADRPATAPEVLRRPVLPAPSAFRRRPLPVDRTAATGASEKDRTGLAASSLSLTEVKGLKPAHCRQRESTWLAPESC